MITDLDIKMNTYKLVLEGYARKLGRKIWYYERENE